MDGVVRLWEGERFKGIVLIERRYEPLGYALPGGFVEVGETVEEAVLREVKEETGLDAQIVKLLGVYLTQQGPTLSCGVCGLCFGCLRRAKGWR